MSFAALQLGFVALGVLLLLALLARHKISLAQSSLGAILVLGSSVAPEFESAWAGFLTRDLIDWASSLVNVVGHASAVPVPLKFLVPIAATTTAVLTWVWHDGALHGVPALASKINRSLTFVDVVVSRRAPSHRSGAPGTPHGPPSSPAASA